MARTIYLLLPLLLPLTQGYITSYSAVPAGKQIEWLKKLTGDICESPAGKLSDEMIEAAPEVMKGWTTSKKVSAENAVAVQSLVKRLVDESKAVNPKAAPTTLDNTLMPDGWVR